jgi:hypothetical protein
MTLQEALKLVNPGDPFLKNMIKALSLHPWLNTDSDIKRLEAAKLVLRNKKRIKFVGGKERYEVIN